MSLVYKPEEVQFPSASGITGNIVPQTPQKLSAVRHQASKIIIMEYKSYHERKVIRANGNALGVYSNFAIGFVDGHVVYESSKLLLDGAQDINWTGRGTEEPGIWGRDVPE
jgi:hypothetical protein